MLFPVFCKPFPGIFPFLPIFLSYNGPSAYSLLTRRYAIDINKRLGTGIFDVVVCLLRYVSDFPQSDLKTIIFR